MKGYIAQILADRKRQDELRRAAAGDDPLALEDQSLPPRDGESAKTPAGGRVVVLDLTAEQVERLLRHRASLASSPSAKRDAQQALEGDYWDAYQPKVDRDPEGGAP